MIGLVWNCIYWPVRFHFSKNTDARYQCFQNWVQGIQNVITKRAQFIEHGNRINLNQNSSVLIIANHQSWLDILVLYAYFGTPLIFVMKRSLRYIPFLGKVFRKMKFPLIDRRAKNVDSWKMPIQAYLKDPWVKPLVIFPEGTRYKQEKAARSRYAGLLNPHVDGVFLVKDAYDQIFDVTIFYPGQYPPSLINLFLGRLGKIVIHVQDRTDLLKSPERRSDVYRALNQIWQEKSNWIKANTEPY
jgi:1-acyl-sn-glycerol-3-phosphate acyltransferase